MQRLVFRVGGFVQQLVKQPPTFPSQLASGGEAGTLAVGASSFSGDEKAEAFTQRSGFQRHHECMREGHAMAMGIAFAFRFQKSSGWD